MNAILHAKDTSTYHFNDTIENNFLDCLATVRDAIVKLYFNYEVSDDLLLFYIHLFQYY